MTDLLKQSRQLREMWIVYQREHRPLSIQAVSDTIAFLDAVIEHLEVESCRVPNKFSVSFPAQDQRTHTLAIMATILATSANANAKFDSIAAAEVMLAEVEKKQQTP